MTRVLLVGLLSGLLGGCVFGPQPKVKAALPLPPQPALTKPAPVLDIPAGITPIETPPESPPIVAKAEVPEEPDPVLPPTVDTTKKPAPRRPRAPVVPVPAAAGQEALAPPVTEPVPQLREILTPEKRTQYEAEFSKSIAEARQALSKTSRRRLTPPQRENVIRIQTFLKQAEASRKDDLGTALQLARRADLLGQDLLKSLLP